MNERDSIPLLLLRLARQELLRHLGLLQGEAFKPRSSSRRSKKRRMEHSRGYATVHPLEREYRTLQAPVGADLATVRACYLRLVKLHHPDQHPHDPERRAEAQEITVQANLAYRRIRAYHEARTPR